MVAIIVMGAIGGGVGLVLLKKSRSVVQVYLFIVYGSGAEGWRRGERGE